VFEHGQDGRWSETATISPADGVVGDGFGMALAVRGNLLAVAAPAADSARGAVYVFERDARGNWAQRARLVVGDGTAGDRLGATLALGADLLLAGAPGRDSARGAVIVCRRAAGGWAEQARLAGPGTVAGDRFGASLALAGDRALVGAPGPQGSNPAQLRAGQAFTFRLSRGAWRDEARLTIEGDTTIRGFGSAVLLDNTGAFVSSPFADRGLGIVLQFTRDGGEWRQRARLTPADSARPALFGAALARAGDELLVGAPVGTGALHVLRAEGASWRATQKLTVEATGLASQFGSAIAVENGVALVGGPGADFFEGTGYLFARDPGGEWHAAGTLVDHTPSSLAAVTGTEVRCDPSGRVRGFPCRDSDLASFLPVSALGARRGIMLNDIWGWTDPETGREFALVGRMDGTAFVEVTDPTRPVYVGELPLHEGARPNLWRDIKVYRNHAFIVSDGAGPHGMQVFDLTQLRAVANPPVTFRETAHYDRIHSAHNIAIDTASGYAYPIGNSMGGETCGGGLHMIDIRNPSQPTFAGCWADTTTGIRRTGYTHDAQCVVYHGPDEQYRGRQICFSSSETAVGIADVTDKQHPTRVSSVTYPNVAYAHQGWLSDDHRYFFLDDEGDELAGTAPTTRTLVFDISDLDDPVVAREFFGTTPASDHNLYVRGRYMYQSNYVAGLRIVDVGDPVNPVEVGYFDTVPFAPDRAGFAGTWSNYPFFKSGVVAVTSMREGLFMVRFRPTAPVP
jgi:choice-of-anchor B domain-containing protein